MSDQVEKQLDDSIEFPIRLTDKDFEPTTSSWLCPALGLPGAEVTEIFFAGKALRAEDYKILRKRTRIQWTQNGVDPPKNITTIMRVSGRKRDDLIESENFWKRFGIVVPIITAAIGALAVMYAAGQKQPPGPTIALTYAAVPVDFQKKMPPPRFTRDGNDFSIPSQIFLNAPATMSMDFTDTVNLIEALRRRDARRTEFFGRLIESLDSVSKPLSDAATRIDRICPGGASGVTPPAGGIAIAAINSVRVIASQLRGEAASLQTESAP